MVSQSDNFGEWNIKTHVPAMLLDLGYRVPTSFTINIPNNRGSVDSDIAGPFFSSVGEGSSRVDSCYYTLGGLHLHGLSMDYEDVEGSQFKDGIMDRFSMDFEFVRPSPSSPSLMFITISYVNVEGVPAISVAKAKYIKQE